MGPQNGFRSSRPASSGAAGACQTPATLGPQHFLLNGWTTTAAGESQRPPGKIPAAGTRRSQTGTDEHENDQDALQQIKQQSEWERIVGTGSSRPVKY